MNYTVTLPWPSSELSPNARGHWAIKARARAGYRNACGWVAKSQGLRKIDAHKLDANIVFHPPSKRRMDLDNMIGAFKSGQDGIVDVCCVDDARWTPTYSRGDVVKDGAVVVTLCPPIEGKTA